MSYMMTGWFYTDLGLFIREAEIDAYEGIPLNFTTIQPPEPEEGKFRVFIGDRWYMADEPPKPYVPPVEPWQIDQEKDRRTAMGFIYEGKAYLTETQSQMNDILGALADATAAITVDQAQPGNLRWADPRYDFAWSAADGSGMPMDAQTCLAFTRAAVRRKSLLVGAGLALKAMNPIPVDYMDDKYWPPMDTSAKAARK